MIKHPQSLVESSALLRWTLCCGVIVLFVWLASARWPEMRLALGMGDYGVGYLDSYAVLAAVDAARIGLDPYAFNGLDPLGRPHVYSEWWLTLQYLGLGRDDNFLVGSLWVGAFAFAVFFTVRARSMFEVIGLTAVLASPPVILAINRANIDLVIFVVLAGCGMAANSASSWRRLVALLCLVLATGLKYFPIVVSANFLWIRPIRRMPLMLAGASILSALALASVWSRLGVSRFFIESTLYTMGAPLFWREVGVPDSDSLFWSILVLVIGAMACAKARITIGLAGNRAGDGDEMRAAVGSTVLVACFLAGVNYGYRWIFAIWPAFWLLKKALNQNIPPSSRWAARVTCGLILFCLWSDGLFCLVVNQFLMAPPAAELDRWQTVWRFSTQPFHWILMILLAGWLVEGAWVSIEMWRQDRREMLVQ